ncbi:MAG: class I SAM-dependent methyltransferase [Aridibacter sp.]
MTEQTLTKEMQEHTYAIMNRVEDSHWWFVGRRAILESFMERIIQDLRFKIQDSKSQSKIQNLKPKILDVGCGTGANLEMLKNFGEAEGVDVSDEALEFCRKKGLKVHKGLAEELPFEDETFDVVTALDVVEHLDDDIAGLREMFRVLKKGGKTLIFVPAFMWLWGVQDDISNHRIRYTKKQIVERLEKAGFEIERATYANITFFAPILAGRTLMKITGVKPESENNINVSALNGLLGKIFSAEKYWLKRAGFPFGVSIVITAKKV